MYKKITDFAFGAKWGSLGANGFSHLVAPSAATVWFSKKPSSLNSPAKAVPAKPAPLCQMNSRRVRPQKFLVIVFVSVFKTSCPEGMVLYC